MSAVPNFAPFRQKSLGDCTRPLVLTPAVPKIWKPPVRHKNFPRVKNQMKPVLQNHPNEPCDFQLHNRSENEQSRISALDTGRFSVQSMIPKSKSASGPGAFIRVVVFLHASGLQLSAKFQGLPDAHAIRKRLTPQSKTRGRYCSKTTSVTVIKVLITRHHAFTSA